MSHFTVIVIGDDPVKQLRPFNEQDEEYFTFNSKEEEYRKEYENGSLTKMKFEDEKGNITLMDTYDQIFENPNYKMWDDQETKYIYPEGWIEVKIPFKDFYKTFDTFCEDWYNSEKDPRTGEYGYWCNPNAKWDWFQLGGRWTGFFKLKTQKLLETNHVFPSFLGYTAAEMESFVRMYKDKPDNFKHITSKFNQGEVLAQKVIELSKDITFFPEHQIGKPGLLTPEAPHGRCDLTKKKNIDFAGMKKGAAEKAYIEWDEVNNVITKSETFISWEEIWKDESISMQQKREKYNSQSEVIEFNVKFPNRSFQQVEKFLIPCEEYIQQASEQAYIPTAILKDGQWYEQGSMGWWGIISDKKDQNDWNKEVNKLLESIDDETLISLYDCHI